MKIFLNFAISKLDKLNLSLLKNLSSFIILLAPLLTFSQEFISFPETYRTEGIPAIRKSDFDRITFDPSEIRSNLIYDTDKKNRRLFITDESNHIYSLSAPLSSPRKMIDKHFPSDVKVNPNGTSLAFTADTDDEDNFQIYLFDIPNNSYRKLANLTGKDESVESFIWSRDGKTLTYMKVDYDSRVSKICQNDLLSENCFPISLSGIWNVLDYDSDKILLKHWKSSSQQLLYFFDTRNAKLHPVDEQGNSQRGFILANSILWTSDGNSKCRKSPCLLTFDFKRKETEQLRLPSDLIKIDGISISPNRKKIAIKESQNGVDIFRIFEFKNGVLGKEFPRFIPPQYVIWNTRWFSDDEIVYTLENVGKPASIQSFNLQTRKFTDWTKEKLPRALENRVKAPEIIKWKSFDSKVIPGYLIRPESKPPKSPVLIFIHGGPQVIDTPVFNLQDTVLAANLGITIIHTNIRGSSGFGNEYLDADNKEKRINAVKDIQSLLDWVEKQPELDSQKIFLRGISYGGFIALSTGLQEPHRIKGVIAEYSIVSIRGYLAQSWVNDFVKNEYGDPADEKLMSELDKLSPLNNTARWNKIPLFLTRGKTDSRTPEKDVVDLKNQLQGRNTEVWYIYSTEDGHGFGGKYVFAAMYEFLQKQINKEKINEKS